MLRDHVARERRWSLAALSTHGGGEVIGGRCSSDSGGVTIIPSFAKGLSLRSKANSMSPVFFRQRKKHSAARVPMFPVGVFAAKEAILSRFAKIGKPGPGYIHLHDGIDADRLKQFAADIGARR